MRIRRFTQTLLLALSVGLWGACSSGSTSLQPTAEATAKVTTEPPKLRLGTAVRPTHYTLEISIIPEEDTFTGTIEMELELQQAQSTLWLNATDLGIERARLYMGQKILEGTPKAAGVDFLGFDFGQPVGPGSAKLHIDYRGAFSRNNTNGLFKQKEEGHWYVYSQFEPIDARRAFPCFDEPSFKVPWQLTLHVKRDNVAVSNTRALSEDEEPNGLKRVKFAETRPLPSYLIAFAVGPFEVVPSKSSTTVPIRVIAPRGRADEVGYAAASTPQLLSLLEQYFGIPYPFDKLDDLAVPITVGFGAMENPGLITFTQARLLMRDDEASIRDRRDSASTTAHELAHQWFGDLVTLAWWNDIWLNEAFATWMGEKTLEQWKPDWESGVRSVQMRSRAMFADTLVSARRIRQPIESNHDIESAFDFITYTKGATVLKMFEHWVGPDKFRKGVQRYLKEHSFKNASSADFVAAISAEAGQDVAPAFSTFLDQPGTPFVSVELDCGNRDHPALRLSQQRFLPVGSTGSSDQRWQIPVCFKYGSAGAANTQCALMTEAKAEVPLTSASSCPEWVLLNEGAAGYYRVGYSNELLTRLFQGGGAQLTLPERIGIIEDLQALTRAGHIPETQALALIPKLINPPNLYLIDSTLAILQGVNEYLVADDLRPNYARFIRKTYGPLAKSLGWHPRQGEPEDTRLLRPRIMSLVADEGQDPKLIREAKHLAEQWLKDHHAVDPDLVDAVLTVTAYNGDRDWYERFHSAAKTERDRKERVRLFRAMAAFRDPELLRESLGLLLSDEFDAREVMAALPGMLGRTDQRITSDARARELLYNFIRQNFDALAKKLPKRSLARLPMVASGLCDQSRRAEMEQFFKKRSTHYPGGPRVLNQSLEMLSLCSAYKSTQQPSVAAFLKKY